MAIGTIVLIAGYYVFRTVVTNCTGAACDAYIPLSLIIPILILVTLAITGVMGTIRAKSSAAWFVILLASAALGVFGPPVALVILRDEPDTFVPIATALELLVAVTALGYSLSQARPSEAR